MWSIQNLIMYGIIAGGLYWLYSRRVTASKTASPATSGQAPGSAVTAGMSMPVGQMGYDGISAFPVLGAFPLGEAEAFPLGDVDDDTMGELGAATWRAMAMGRGDHGDFPNRVYARRAYVRR